MKPKDTTDIYKIRVTNISKETYKLEEYKGKVMLIVNVASKCGLANKSYQELSDLLTKFHSKGLRILLFPCKQFLDQEHSELKLVKEFVEKYHDKFILMDAVDVKGTNIHPLFEHLINGLSGFITNTIKWNFTYFLIGRNGELIKRYGPTDRLTDKDEDLLKFIGNGPFEPESLKATSTRINVEFDEGSDESD